MIGPRTTPKAGDVMDLSLILCVPPPAYSMGVVVSETLRALVRPFERHAPMLFLSPYHLDVTLGLGNTYGCMRVLSRAMVVCKCVNVHMCVPQHYMVWLQFPFAHLKS